MFDLTGSPDFMAGLRAALLVAAREMFLCTDATAVRDPENEWLTSKEARAFLRLSESAFLRLRKRLEDEGREHEIVVSSSVNNTEPRYQLASLQQFMRKGAPALPKPESPAPPNGKPLNGKAHPPLRLVRT